MSAEHGRYAAEQRRPRPPARYTPISNADLSAPEIVAFDDLKACGSMAAAKEKGLVRSEGKDYVMNDGDVTLFRFNV